MAGAATLLAPGLVRAQAATVPTLAGVEAALDSGRVESAREGLQRWFAVHGEAADRNALARARFLRARLTQDADSAEVEYLWVAIDSGSPYGAIAWLRLAQLHLERGDPDRALQDLERLRSEYPESPERAESWLWSGLALEASGDLPGACRIWERATRDRAAGDADEVGRRIRTAREACGSGGMRLTVQIGAFRSREAAESLRKRAGRAGFEARVRRLGDGLWRVRVGHFASVDSARGVAARLRERSFSAVITSEEP
ncbi:MAG: SPOR domain-containing protein [Gemmatimonadota bacterium]